jgi:hypothetical protein
VRTLRSDAGHTRAATAAPRRKSVLVAKNKKQHFIPKCYLKAWCDPQTPPGQDPYVWLFSKDGGESRRKSPDNVFHETDMYTIHSGDGERNLVLEHGLSQLEHEFVQVRDRTLDRQRSFDASSRLYLVAFVAAMYLRTPAQRDHQASQWGAALKLADDMKAWADSATPEERASLASALPPGEPKNRISYEDVKAAAEQPMQTLFLPQMRALVPMLAQLDFVVLVASGEHRFITSDFPCVWFDSEAYRRPQWDRSVGLMYPGIEVTLPLSPKQMVLFNRKGASGYVPVPGSMVDDLNRRTRFHCHESFVNWEDSTLPVWFDPGTPPPDAGASHTG